MFCCGRRAAFSVKSHQILDKTIGLLIYFPPPVCYNTERFSQKGERPLATLLLIVIFIAFIGLGLPDSLFGAAWPAIYTEMALPVSWANFVTMLVSGGTIVSSLLSARLIHRFGTPAVTAVSTAMTAAALFGFSVSGSMVWLCLFAVPLGLGAGAIDTGLNNYVALHYKATHMNFLHCFYGIGVSVSPFLMSLALSNGSWRSGYRTVFWIQLGVAVLMLVSLPLWKRVGHVTQESEAEESRPVPFKTLLKDAKVRMACLVFVGSCALECTCGAWGSTFLVRAKGLEADAAALTITFYYVGMAVGRFLSGVLATKLTASQLVRIGQSITFFAILLVLLPLPAAVSGVGLFMIGLGNGPVFPNMLHLTPRIFGKELSQSVMGVQMSASYVGILLAPALFGLLAQNITAALFPYYLAIWYALMLTGRLFLQKKQKA